MIAEGDEYQAKILSLRPYIVLLTNIEYDHPDFYKDEEAYREVFSILLRSLPESAYVVAHKALESFIEKETSAHVVYFQDDPTLELELWGVHNRVNASGALAVARVLGVQEDVARKALEHFRGTKRRMELYTSKDAPVVVVDDYAHHPTEIRATLSALRAEYPDRHIVAVFQPHTYSRTQALADDFTQAFQDADEVLLLDIYGSARETEKLISGEQFAARVALVHAHTRYAQSIQSTVTYCRAIVSPAVIVALGAGNVWEVARDLTIQSEAH